MTLHQLRIFDSVVRHGNITKASGTLHISQPTVSQQLKLLEEEFGRKFLVRLSTGVELTDDGRRFSEAVRGILSQAETIEQTFKSKKTTGKTGSLVVGGTHNVSVNLVPRLLMAFQQDHPAVQVSFETNDSPIIERRLIDGELEIAVLTNPSYRAELVYEPYEKMEVVAFCLPINPVAGRKLDLEEFLQCPLVVRSNGRIEKALISLGCKSNIAVRCGASEAVKAAVRMGMGVGVLYRNAIAGQITNGTLRVVQVDRLAEMGIISFVVHDRRKPLASNAQEFLEIIRQKRTVDPSADNTVPDFYADSLGTRSRSQAYDQSHH